MDVTLPADLEKRVQDRISRGDYASAEALVTDAVARLLDDEAEGDLDEIRSRVVAAEAEFERGEFTEYGVDEMDRLNREIRERGLKRLRG